MSRMRAVRTPSSAIPTIGGVDRPSARSTEPAKRPWLDSTRPMAAISGHVMWHDAWLPAAARTYASRATAGMPLAASGDSAAAGRGLALAEGTLTACTRADSVCGGAADGGAADGGAADGGAADGGAGAGAAGAGAAGAAGGSATCGSTGRPTSVCSAARTSAPGPPDPGASVAPTGGAMPAGTVPTDGGSTITAAAAAPTAAAPTPAAQRVVRSCRDRLIAWPPFRDQVVLGSTKVVESSQATSARTPLHARTAGCFGGAPTTGPATPEMVTEREGTTPGSAPTQAASVSRDRPAAGRAATHELGRIAAAGPAPRPATGRTRRDRAARVRRGRPRVAPTSDGAGREVESAGQGGRRPQPLVAERARRQRRHRRQADRTGRWRDGQAQDLAGGRAPAVLRRRAGPGRALQVGGGSRTATTTTAATTASAATTRRRRWRCPPRPASRRPSTRRPHGGLERRARARSAGFSRAIPAAVQPASAAARPIPTSPGPRTASPPITASAPPPTSAPPSEHAESGRGMDTGGLQLRSDARMRAARRHPGTTRSIRALPRSARGCTRRREVFRPAPAARTLDGRDGPTAPGGAPCRCRPRSPRPAARRTLARSGRTTATIPRAATSSSASTARRSGSARSGGRPRRRPGAARRCGSCTPPPTSAAAAPPAPRRPSCPAPGASPRWPTPSPGTPNRACRRRPRSCPATRSTRLLRAAAAGQLLVLGSSTTGAADEMVLATLAARVAGRLPRRRSSSSPAAAGRRPDGRPVVAILGVGDRADDEAVAEFAATAAQRFGVAAVGAADPHRAAERRGQLGRRPGRVGRAVPGPRGARTSALPGRPGEPAARRRLPVAAAGDQRRPRHPAAPLAGRPAPLAAPALHLADGAGARRCTGPSRDAARGRRRRRLTRAAGTARAGHRAGSAVVGSSVVDVGPRLAVVLVVLTALAAVAGRLSGLGQDRPIVIAAAARHRAAGRGVGGAARRRPVAAAVRGLRPPHAHRRDADLGRADHRARPARTRGRPAGCCPPRCRSSVGAAPVVALVLASGTVPLRGTAVIPIAGILIGGAMTATSLAGRRLRDELHGRRGEVEAALALGLLPRDAVLLIGGPVGGHRARPRPRPDPDGRPGHPARRLRRRPAGRRQPAAGRRRPAAGARSACSPPRCSRSGPSPS